MSRVSYFKRYRDGYWIPSLKRTYLYWFKFLQEAELHQSYEVDWSKYKGWGGSNYILGTKFDNFWEENWKDLFGVKNKGDEPRYPLSTTQVKTDAIRICYLIWLHRDTPKTRRTNTLDIAEKILKTEKRMATHNIIYTWDLNDERNPTTPKEVQTLINRYQRKTKQIFKNVCVGMFP